MKVTSLLQFSCLANALLLRFAQSVPVRTNLGDSAPLDASNNIIASMDKTQEYMMNLYNRFENNRFEIPTANIVRSFRNINMKDQELSKNIHDNGLRSGYKSHVLTFNITSISRQETVSLAELRVFKLIKHDKNSYANSVERTISVLDILNPEIGLVNTPDYKLVQSFRVDGYYSDWETLNITSTVERWLKSGKSIHKMEVRIEPLKFWFWNSFGSMDIEISPNDKEPSLLVYSNEKSTKKRKRHASERQELMSRDFSSHPVHGNVRTRTKRNIFGRMKHLFGMNNSTSKRKQRRKVINDTYCRRRRMYVNFQDINWTWVIAPKGYQAYQCVGRCMFHANQRLFTSKHAIIQSLQHSHYRSANRLVQNREERRFAKRPCCVPTKLKPISMLYRDPQGVMTYKYKYDGMVVEQCGCR